MQTETKVFPASVDSLEPMRDFVTAWCENASVNKKKTYGLCLAIDEIATNIIRYGYPLAGVADGVVTVAVTVSDDEKQLTVALEDTASPFNPFDHLVPSEEDMQKPLEERPIGGLGILLARQNVDEYNYELEEGKNKNIFIVNVQS